MNEQTTVSDAANIRAAIEGLDRLDFDKSADGLMPVIHGRFIRRADVLYLFDLLAQEDGDD